jgi:hypothetical protein
MMSLTVEFNLYNPNYGIFTSTVISFEHWLSGYVMTKTRTRGIKVHLYQFHREKARLILEIFFVLFVI